MGSHEWGRRRPRKGELLPHKANTDGCLSRQTQWLRQPRASSIKRNRSTEPGQPTHAQTAQCLSAFGENMHRSNEADAACPLASVHSGSVARSGREAYERGKQARGRMATEGETQVMLVCGPSATAQRPCTRTTLEPQQCAASQQQHEQQLDRCTDGSDKPHFCKHHAPTVWLTPTHLMNSKRRITGRSPTGVGHTRWQNCCGTIIGLVPFVGHKHTMV